MGAFVEYQFRSDVPMDNANLLWAPGYGVVNADIHYTRDIEDSFIKKFTVYFDVKNIFDRTYSVFNHGRRQLVHHAYVVAEPRGRVGQ